MNKLLVAALLLFTFSAHALNLSEEIQALNQAYGKVMGYPILIFDKEEIRSYLKQQGVLDSAKEYDQAKAIYQYTQEKFNVQLAPADAHNLVPYIAGLNNGAASALPFWSETRKMRYCAVLPNGVTNSHHQEIKRILGALDQEHIFQGFDFSKDYSLMSVEELRLFSLYHELSHCLDQNFLPALYEFEVDPHQVHLAESFAEVNALFLLAQRKDLNKLGISRSILRALYSKYYGPYLAKAGPSLFGGPMQERGGSIYFLTTSLLKAQKEIESYQRNVKQLSLEKTLALSKEIVEHHAFSSRSFQAVHMSFANGRDEAIAHYKKLSQKAPNLFFQAYQDLLYFNSVLDSVEDVLNKGPE